VIFVARDAILSQNLGLAIEVATEEAQTLGRRHEQAILSGRKTGHYSGDHLAVEEAGQCHESTNGKLVDCGPVIWDSNRGAPK